MCGCGGQSTPAVATPEQVAAAAQARADATRELARRESSSQENAMANSQQ